MSTQLNKENLGDNLGLLSPLFNRIFDSNVVNEFGTVQSDKVLPVRNLDIIENNTRYSIVKSKTGNQKVLIDKGYIFDNNLKIIIMPNTNILSDPEVIGKIFIDDSNINKYLENGMIPAEYLYNGIEKIKKILGNNNLDIFSFIDFSTVPDEYKYNLDFLQSIITLKNSPDFHNYMKDDVNDIEMYRFRVNEINDSRNFTLIFDTESLIDLFTGYPSNLDKGIKITVNSINDPTNQSTISISCKRIAC